MRIINMLSQAQQNASSGKRTDAERFAREAVQLAENESDSTGRASAGDSEEAQTTATTPGEETNEDTPASQASDVDPNQPMQRNTTSYTDGSDDSGISFQSAQPITSAQAPFAVRAHELSHIRRETSDAILNGQRVLTSVTIQSHIDPSTGERQIGGGRARIVVFPNITVQTPTGQNLDVTG